MLGAYRTSSLVFGFCLLALVTVSVPSQAQSGSAYSTDQVLKGIEAREKAWEEFAVRGELITVMDAAFFQKTGKPTPQSKPKMFFVYGHKGKNEVFAVRPATSPQETLTAKTILDMATFGDKSYYDGQTTHLEYSNPTGSNFVASRGRMIPEPTYIMGLSLPGTGKTLREALTSATFREETKDPDWGTLLAYDIEKEIRDKLAMNLGVSTMQVWVAPERDYLPARIQLDVSNPLRRMEFRISRVSRVDNRWVPQEFILIDSLSDGTRLAAGKTTTSRITAHQVGNIPADTVRVQMAPGSRLTDSATTASWRVGSNGEKMYIDKQNPQAQRTMFSGWIYIASVTTLLVLTVLGYVRWKSKQ